MTDRNGRWAERWVGILGIAMVACGSSPPHGDDDDDTDPPIDPPPGCLDEDRDGAGEGADCTASDCDDTDPAIQSECGQDCGSHPDRKGCPCDAAGPVPCYRGPEETAGVGICRAGLARCEEGVWSGCDGQQLPVVEACDESDDDCDGTADNGVLSECGTCGPCESHCFGPEEGCTQFAESEVHNLIETPERYLTLDGTSVTLHVIWPSSSTEGKIFRVDTRSHEVLGAYWTGTGHAGEWSADSPSRTAVDDRGNVLIANRGGSGVASSFTKIAANPADCPDRNGNGQVDTSQGWDDLLEFDDEEDWEDECILWHTVLPAGGARPIGLYRSDELDGPGSELGWACTFDNQRCYQFVQETGELTGEEVNTFGVSPYGGAVDRDGWFWIVGWAVGRFLVDDAEDSWESIGGGGSLMRAMVDENNVPWFTGDDLYRWNRDDESWERANLNLSPGHLASDGRGSIWVATYLTDELVFRVDNDEEMEWHTVATPGTMTFGIAADFEGQVWTFGWGDGFTGGSASVIQVDTEEAESVLDDCGGNACVMGPYVRGDITGLQRRNAIDPAGEWSGLFEGCAEGVETTWHQVRIDGDTPPGTRIVVSARMADTVQGLAAASAVHLGTVPDDGAELDLGGAFVESGALVRVDVLLEAEQDEEAPVLRGIHVDYGCPPVIE